MPLMKTRLQVKSRILATFAGKNLLDRMRETVTKELTQGKMHETERAAQKPDFEFLKLK